MTIRPVILDRDIDAMRRLQDHVGYDVPTMIATRARIEKALAFADLLVCSVAVHGERTPVLVTRDMLRLMTPRSIIMDLSLDQGGCCETSRPTDFSNPTFMVDDIIHFCVPNLPSSASRASTRALTNSILPYITCIADQGFDAAIRSSSAIRRGTYTYDGHCVRRQLADELGAAPGLPQGVHLAGLDHLHGLNQVGRSNHGIHGILRDAGMPPFAQNGHFKYVQSAHHWPRRDADFPGCYRCPDMETHHRIDGGVVEDAFCNHGPGTGDLFIGLENKFDHSRNGVFILR